MKEIGFITIARVLVVVGQLINIKLYTNYLSVGQLGLYFFLLTVSYFANALIFGPIDYYQQAILRKINQASGGIRPLLMLNLKLISYYCLVNIVAVTILALQFPQYISQFILATSLAVAIYIVQALRNTLNNLDYQRIVSFNFVQEAVIKVVIFLLLVKFFQPSELLLMVAWLISLLACAIMLLLRAKKYGLFRCTKQQLIQSKEVFYFSYPISVSAVANWIQLQGYRLVLVPMGYAEIVGIFATVASIGSAAMAAAATIFNQAFSPNIYKTAGRYTATYLRNATLLIAGILFATLLMGDHIVRMATSSAFQSYWMIMIYGVLIDACNLIAGALVVHITLKLNTKKIMHSSVIGVISLIGSFSFFFLTQNLTVHTIGLPLLFSQSIVIAYMYLEYRKCKFNRTTQTLN